LLNLTVPNYYLFFQQIGNLLRDKKPVSLTIERGPSVQSNAVNNNGQKTVVGSPLSPTTSASPSSDTATALRHSTISDSDVVGVMRNTTQRTTGVVKRRSTLPRGFDIEIVFFSLEANL
jgi:hypothetical protein